MVDVRPPAAGERSTAPRARDLAVEELAVECGKPVPAGVDGESVLLEPPLRFRIRPHVLRVRIAPSHPGASPSAIGGASALSETAAAADGALTLGGGGDADRQIDVERRRGGSPGSDP